MGELGELGEVAENGWYHKEKAHPRLGDVWVRCQNKLTRHQKGHRLEGRWPGGVKVGGVVSRGSAGGMPEEAAQGGFDGAHGRGRADHPQHPLTAFRGG